MSYPFGYPSGTLGTSTGGGGMDPLTMAALLGGGLLGGGGAYFGAKEQADQAQAAANMSEQAKAWTQLLGMGMLDDAGPEFKKSLEGYLKTMQEATDKTDLLPSVAKQGQQAQLGQLAGAEQGAISHVMRANKQMMGGVGQSAASKGFYGSSIQGGQSNQMQANTNQSIADIMAGFAGQKAGVIGQGTQNVMQGLMGKAAGKQAMAGAQLQAGQQKYGLTTDKLNLLLQTGNQYGVDVASLLHGLAENPDMSRFINLNAYGVAGAPTHSGWHDLI